MKCEVPLTPEQRLFADEHHDLVYNIHLLFRYPFCQIMQEQLFFQLAHERVRGSYGFFQCVTSVIIGIGM